MKFVYQTNPNERAATIKKVGDYHAKRRSGFAKWLARKKSEELPDVLKTEVEMLQRKVNFYSWMREVDQAVMFMIRILCFVLAGCLVGYAMTGRIGGEFTRAALTMAFNTVITMPFVKLTLWLVGISIKDVLSMMTVLSEVFGVKTDESAKLMEVAIDALAADTLYSELA